MTEHDQDRAGGQADKAHGWNVEQILVYVWHCLGDEMDEQEYPYEKFTNSEMGKRLRLELAALAASRVTPEPAALREALQSSIPVMEYYLRVANEENLPTVQLAIKQARAALAAGK